MFPSFPLRVSVKTNNVASYQSESPMPTVYCLYSVFGNLYEIFRIARYAIRKIKERT